MLIGWKALAGMVAALAAKGTFDPEPAFKVLAQESGADSHIESPRAQLVADSPTWRLVWKAHKNSMIVSGYGQQRLEDGIPAPAVDFTKNVVICLFGGQSQNVGGFVVAQVGETEDTAVIRIRPQTLPSLGPSVQQTPYILLVVPRTRKKIAAQLDQTQLGGQGWRTLATFEPTKKPLDGVAPLAELRVLR